MRVLIIDDQRLLGEAIRPLLEAHGCRVLNVVRTAGEAMLALDEEHVDVVLVEVILSADDGIAVGQRIVERWPATKVIAFTSQDEPGTVRKMVSAGFHGYITKNVRVSELVSYLRAVVDGRTRIGVPAGRRRMVEGQDHGEWHAAFVASQLTKREREVLRLLVEGVDGDSIASTLSISSNTVRSHIQNVLSKLQVHSRLAAVAFATRHRMVLLPTSRIGADVEEAYGNRTHPAGGFAVALP
jgi:DNA-binding NarL/FixJ family response regulator